MPVNIAIDGPAGAGKSTIAKAVSSVLGYIYVDTGALYRAVAYAVMSDGISPKDAESVIAALENIKPELRFIDGSQYVYLNGEDVTDKIRAPELSMGASDVSAIPAVRDFLFALQRDIAKNNNVIMDGRDIGTVVLPNADLKIFLTATPEDRARRRHLELSQKGDSSSYEQVLEDIKKRDYNDSTRETAPLKLAKDAVLADTTGFEFEQSVKLISDLINRRLKARL